MGKKLLIFLLIFTSSILGLSAQSKTVKGRVTDSEGEPLTGVSVVIKGTTNGAMTDWDGNYSVAAVPNEGVLVLSFVGFHSKEVKVTGETHNVVLDSNDTLLDEVIVVAYGTASKAGYTGAASTVSKEKIAQAQVSNVSRLLQGTAAGVQSVASSGQPGSEAAIYIRGVGSINASSKPLYVVDGAPYDGDLSAINPADIESVSVMKDAASTALYGSRAGNGLVIITTKQGVKDDKVKIDASFKYGFSSRAIKDYKKVSTNNYYELYWEALRNQELYRENKTPVAAAEYASDQLTKRLGINPYGSAYPRPVGVDGKLADGATPLWDDDWEKEYTQNAKRMEAQLGFSGGSKKMAYYVSLGYLNDEGIALASDFKRYSARVNLNGDITSWLRFNTGISLTHSDSKSPAGDDSSLANTINFARNMPNFYPIWVRDDNGNFKDGVKTYDYGYGDGTANHYRPSAASPKYNHLGSSAYDFNRRQREMASLRGSIEIDLYKGLMYRGSANLDFANRVNHNYTNPEIGSSSYNEIKGSVSKYNYRDTRFTGNNVLTYTRTFNDVHNMKVLLGQEYYEYNTNNFYGSRSGFPILGFDEPVAASLLGNFSGSGDSYKLLSYFANAEYNYAHKYFGSLSLRSDGSSRFHPDTRWGTFWSVGASWRINQENFLKDIKEISILTLRGSYGGQGNDGISTYYGYKSLFNMKPNLGLPGFVTGSLANPDLKWETNLNLNIAIDYGFFNKRLFGSIEYFNRRSKDLLFEIPMALSTGYGGYLANIGSMKNTGVEFIVTGVPVETKDFQLEVSLNATHYKNKITSLPSERIISGNKLMRVGGSIYDFYLVEWAGVNPENGLPQWYKTVNGERVKTEIYDEANNEDSKIIAGTSLPDLTGGFSINFKYRDFDFGTLFAYSLGGKIYNGDKTGLLHNGSSAGRAMSVDMLDRWTPENTNTDVPRLQTTNTYSWTSSSTRFLVNADYLRMKNISLGYTIPKPLLRQIGINNLRVYAQAENFLTIFGEQGLDPEQSITGSTYFRYPAMKTMSFGFNLGF